jgi:uncharacterized membrane protein
MFARTVARVRSWLVDDLDHLPPARAWRSIGIFVIGVAIVALLMAQISLPGTRPVRVAAAVAVVAIAAYLLTFLAWPRHRDSADEWLDDLLRHDDERR